MKNKNINNKIDMFFKVIKWAYDEVFKEEEVIMVLVEYFANLDFQLVDKPTPLELIIC
jgi:hypothetical protein